MKGPKHLIIYLLVLFLALSIQYANQESWRTSNSKQIINSDGIGYYAHLPALFLYNMEYGFVDKKIEQGYIPNYAAYYFKINENGKRYNMTFFGNAIMMLPAFLIALLLSVIFKQPIDGYNPIFQIAININAIIFSLLGLFLINLYLKRKNISLNARLWSIGSFYAATNLCYYSMFEPAMAHHYLFFVISLMIYILDKFIESPNIKSFVILSALYGFIIIIRPSNGIAIVLVPFFFSGLSHIKSFLSNNKQILIKAFAWGAPAFLSVLFIQMAIWKIDGGHWLVYGYGEKGFNFLSPNMVSILFSYKKGLFIYTPLSFISLFGIYYIYKQSKYKAIVLFISFLFISYVLSSWWSWYYGASYGLRAYIDYYVIFIIPMAYLLENFKFKKILYAIIIGILIYTQIQIYQHRRYILNNWGLNKELYWDIFMRTNKKYYGHSFEPEKPDISNIEPIIVKYDFENTKNSNIIDSISHEGKYSLRLPSRQTVNVFVLDKSKFDVNADYFMEVSYFYYAEKTPGYFASVAIFSDSVKPHSYLTNYTQDWFYNKSKKWKQQKYTRNLGKLMTAAVHARFAFKSESDYDYYIDDLIVKYYPIIEN